MSPLIDAVSVFTCYYLSFQDLMSLSRLYWCCWFCCCWSAKKFRIIFFTPKCQHIHGNVNVCPELKYFMLRYFILWIFFGIEVRVNRNPHKKRSTRLSFFSRKAINKNRGKWIMHPMLQYVDISKRNRESEREKKVHNQQIQAINVASVQIDCPQQRQTIEGSNFFSHEIHQKS